MNKLLGSRIKELRIAKGFTQEYIADLIGVSRQKFARIESGENSINFDILSQISQILDVSVNDITRVLDESPTVEFRSLEDESSSKSVFDMLDLFYANKHMYNKLHHNNTV